MNVNEKNFNLDAELELQSWLDGELTGSAADRASRHADNPLAAELRAVKQAMRGNELPIAVPDTRAFYFSQIQRAIAREEQAAAKPAPAAAPAKSWMRWFAPALGFGAMACLALLAFRPAMTPAFDEFSSTADGTEAITYNDQNAGMTVVWLANADDSATPALAPVAAPAVDLTPVPAAEIKADETVE
jgi:hypothetical protein